MKWLRIILPALLLSLSLPLSAADEDGGKVDVAHMKCIHVQNVQPVSENIY